MKQYSFIRRAFLVLVLKLIMFLILIVRLFYLQIINFKKYKNIAYKNRVLIIPLIPLRGKIFDCNGVLLASNIKSYHLLLSKIKYTQNRNIINNIVNVLGLSDYTKQNINRIMQNTAYKSYGIILNNLSWENVLKIETELYNIDGLILEVYYCRNYVTIIFTCHIIGYVKLADNNKSQLLNYNDENPYDNNINNEIIPNKIKIQSGFYGIEKQLNHILQGYIGYNTIEVDVYGNYTRKINSFAAYNGEDIHLSIDSKLQKIIFEELLDDSCAIMANLSTNKLLAMVSKPGFDSNKLSDNITDLDWNEIVKNKSLFNKCIQGQYNPGSIFKLVVIMCALENNIKPNFQAICTSKPFLGEHFHCWYKPGHGLVKTMQDAIAKSCNHYMFTLAKILGIKKILATAKKFGFGSKTNIKLDHENFGSLKYKDKKLATLLMLSIGQGFILATPMQLNKLISIIATNKFSSNSFNYLDKITTHNDSDEILKISQNIDNNYQNKDDQEQIDSDDEISINQKICFNFSDQITIANADNLSYLIYDNDAKYNGDAVNFNQNKINYNLSNLNFANYKSKNLNLNLIPYQEAIKYFKEEHLAIIRQGMYQAVNLPFGTSYRFRPSIDGLVLSGKTSTVQIVSRDKYAIAKKNHAFFSGYFTYKNQKYSITIILAHGDSGKFATQKASNILKKYFT